MIFENSADERNSIKSTAVVLEANADTKNMAPVHEILITTANDDVDNTPIENQQSDAIPATIYASNRGLHELSPQSSSQSSSF